VAGVFVTALYSFRMYFLVFHGKSASQGHAHHDPGTMMRTTARPSSWSGPGPEAARVAVGGDAAAGAAGHPSVIIGAIAIEPMLFGDFFKGVIQRDRRREPPRDGRAGGRVPRLGAMALHG
jgi:NADH-quinone oxidoreductase subunit L